MNAEQTLDRPAGLTEEHLVYLDALRKSGVTNMFGAAPYLMRAFGITRPTATKYLGFWMRTFSERLKAGEIL
jgi:hypothetical protein